VQLFERRCTGVRRTAAGYLVLRRATAVRDPLAATARELSGLPPEGGPCGV